MDLAIATILDQNNFSDTSVNTTDKNKIGISNTHYLADKLSESDKYVYASLLGNVLQFGKKITSADKNMFDLIVKSLDIATHISLDTFKVSAQNIKSLFLKLYDIDKKIVLFFDVMLLSRSSSPPSKEQLEFINELANTFLLDQDDIELCIYWVGKILELSIDINVSDKYIYKNTTDIPVEITKEHYSNTFLVKGMNLISYHINVRGSKAPEGFRIASLLRERMVKSHATGILLSSGLDEYSHYYYEMIVLPDYLRNWCNQLKNQYK